MCISKNIQEINVLTQGNERPMRWPAAEKVAGKFTEATLNVIKQMEKDLFAALPEPQSFQSVLIQSRKEKHIKKKYTESDLLVFRQRLISYGISNETMLKFDSVFQDALNALMVGDGTAVDSDAVFNRYYKETFEAGLDKAYEDAVEQIVREDSQAREWFENNVSPVYTFTTTSPFVQDLYSSGFRLITSTISIQKKSEAFRAIADGLDLGLPWDAIARNLHRSVGIGNGWHWKRLVRTEMVGAFDRSSRERYKSMGVKFYKYSMVPGACPICQNLNSHNGGYYLPATAPAVPDSTHPNCRCRYLPKWSLPGRISESTLISNPFPLLVA